MGDMTADMASDYEKIEVAGDSQIVVTLVDKVNKEFCSKPDRKQKFEDEMLALVGKKFRIDFIASQKAMSNHSNQPKLTRVQQIRKLQDHEFVANAMRMFDAEVTGFKEPLGRK